MTASVTAIRKLDAAAAKAAVPELANILIDCVANGASVSFMHPLEPAEAEAFFSEMARSVADGKAELFVAEENGKVLGTVALVPADKPNQPHRADVAKMLVHTSARRRGIAEALMRAIEAEARARGLTLLTLDTQTGENAERLYERLGWTSIGIIPNFALYPDGRPGSATFFYKAL